MVSLAAWIGLVEAMLTAHPTHTSSAELAVEADSLQVVVRIFSDDLPTGRDPGVYAADRLRVTDAAGRPVRLVRAGAARDGDVVTIRLGAPLEGSLSGGSIANTILTDRFGDQVNVVRATYGRRTATLIFVRGDGPKALP